MADPLASGHAVVSSGQGPRQGGLAEDPPDREEPDEAGLGARGGRLDLVVGLGDRRVTAGPVDPDEVDGDQPPDGVIRRRHVHVTLQWPIDAHVVRHDTSPLLRFSSTSRRLDGPTRGRRPAVGVHRV